MVFDEATKRIIPADLSTNPLPRVSESPNDLATLASYCNASKEIFGDVTQNLRQLSMNTAAYEKDKAKSFERLLETLSSHPVLHTLTEYVPDPENDGKQVLRIFPMLRGTKTDDKEQVLNDALVVFVKNLRTRDGKVYQPNVIKKILDQIFAVLQAHRIGYTMHHMQSIQGSFQAYCADQFREQAELRPEYGRRPFKALVEFNDVEIFRTQANPPIDPFNNPQDCLRIGVYLGARLGITWQGGKSR